MPRRVRVLFFTELPCLYPCFLNWHLSYNPGYLCDTPRKPPSWSTRNHSQWTSSSKESSSGSNFLRINFFHHGLAFKGIEHFIQITQSLLCFKFTTFTTFQKKHCVFVVPLWTVCPKFFAHLSVSSKPLCLQYGQFPRITYLVSSYRCLDFLNPILTKQIYLYHI